MLGKSNHTSEWEWIFDWTMQAHTCKSHEVDSKHHELERRDLERVDTGFFLEGSWNSPDKSEVSYQQELNSQG